jgi:hypothetical protein
MSLLPCFCCYVFVYHALLLFFAILCFHHMRGVSNVWVFRFEVVDGVGVASPSAVAGVSSVVFCFRVSVYSFGSRFCLFFVSWLCLCFRVSVFKHFRFFFIFLFEIIVVAALVSGGRRISGWWSFSSGVQEVVSGLTSLVSDLWWRCCVLLVGLLSHVIGEAPPWECLWGEVMVDGVWCLEVRRRW